MIAKISIVTIFLIQSGFALAQTVDTKESCESNGGTWGEKDSSCKVHFNSHWDSRISSKSKCESLGGVWNEKDSSCRTHLNSWFSEKCAEWGGQWNAKNETCMVLPLPQPPKSTTAR